MTDLSPTEILSESDTRSKLIDPVLHGIGWTEDLIRREESAGSIEIVGGAGRRKKHGRVDYTLRAKAHPDSQPVAVALIEAKASRFGAAEGLDQVKAYAASGRRLHVPFVYSSNGYLYVEYDATTGMTQPLRPLSEFPSPAVLRARYEAARGFSLDDPTARPLLTPYVGGEAGRRYYQDAAIRAALEKIARGDDRVLLSLVTGAGKTYIAVNLLRRIADAGQLSRALFVCDRDELRSQAASAFQGVFGADAAVVGKGNPQKNARVLIATYHTLDVASDEADANFLMEHYPQDYFSHIIIDECHRSAWGKWSQVLTRNPRAVQVGLTATPRQIIVGDQDEETKADEEVKADEKISADNVKHFGVPAYEYEMGQAIEDGYLAAYELVRRKVSFGDSSQTEAETGIDRKDLADKRLTDARTGQVVDPANLKAGYNVHSFEGNLQLPERVEAMARDLFDNLLKTGGPEQKTIIFCARDTHADAVAIAMNNLYAAWCQANNKALADPYAFKATSENNGIQYLADLRGASRHHFVATTVDLLSTGVDVPSIRNIVFFKYVRSPISFLQMVGRGTRLDPVSGKLMYRIYDYTNATRLFGEDIKQRAVREPTGESEEAEQSQRRVSPIIEVQGFDVRVTDAGTLILANVDGAAVPITLEEYKEKLAQRLLAEAPTLDEFRTRWVMPALRRELFDRLPDPRAADLVRALSDMAAYDLYDVLADLGYGMAPHTRQDRADAFGYKSADWLATMPTAAAGTVQALARQFALAGTESLENPQVFSTLEVRSAGGITALQSVGRPADVLRETKERMFSV